MTIELPEGAKSFSLPNGQTIDVPMGAKSMDLPDELMKPTQYSGGFNQPQKQGWTQQEIEAETQQPWERFLSSFTKPSKPETPKMSGEEKTIMRLRQGLGGNEAKDYEESIKRKQATDLMAREDALDKSSQWSHIYDSFFGDNKEKLRAEDRARLAQKYDDTFKTAGLGRLGEDDNGEYYLIDREGNNIPINGFMGKIASDMKANGGTIGASIAGGMTGAKYGASLPIADPRLKALATTVGALGGSAIGAFGGSLGDTAVNASKNGKEFDIDFALKKATEEAIADGLIGGTVELGVKGAKAIGGIARGAKEYAIDGNLNGARSLATKEAGVNPSEIYSNRSAYETVPNENARELAQDELASAAMTRERLWNEVAPEVKGDVKASTEVANSTTSRANALLEQAEKGAIEPEEVIRQIKAYENDVKSTYGQMVDDISKIAPDFRASTDDVQATLENAINNVIGTETDAQLKKILNIVQKQDSHSVQDLFALRKKVNAISTDNFEDLSVIRQLNEQLNDKIGAAIDTIPDATMASRLREGFDQNRRRYAEMFKMQDQDIYKDIMKNSINPEQASKKLLYYAKAYQDRLNEITRNIAPEARAGIEMRVITDAIKDSLVETSDGFKAVDFKSLNEMIKKINTSNLKSENAKVLLETIQDMSKLFGLDAQMLTDVSKGMAKQPTSGIATTIAGRFEAMRTSFATKFLLSYLPTQAGKSMAFKRHVLESLRKARSPKEFLTLAEQYPNAPKTIWKQMRQAIDDYEQKLAEEQEIAFKQQEQEQIAKEARMAEKEAEKARQAEELKARAETTEFSSQELRALTDMTTSNNERQAAMRLLQGQDKEGDKALVLALKEKLGTKLDDEISRRIAREEELKAMREQAKRDAEFIKANQGSVQTGKSLSNADINSKFVGDEDARAAAYKERFAGKSETEHQGTAETLTAKEQKSIDDGTATEDTLLKQRRIKQELEAKGLTPDEAPKSTTGNALLDSVMKKPKKPIEAPTPQSKPIEGSATAEESAEAMKELQGYAQSKKQTKKPKTYSDDEDIFTSDDMTDFKKELLDETGIDVDTLTTPQSWNKTGKVSKMGSVQMGIADYAMRKINNELLSKSYPEGFVPNKNIPKGAIEAKDSFDIFRGRSVAGRMNGKNKAFIDGLVFDVIAPDKSLSKSIEFARTTGDKYAVAKGISNIINETFPKLSDEADVVIEPYGASLSFVSNLDFARDMIKKGKDYYVSVSSYFEPNKSAVYSAIKNGEANEIRTTLGNLMHGSVSGKYALELKEIFKKDKNGALNKAQIRKAMENLYDFEQILSAPNLHLVDELDNMMFKRARDEVSKEKKVVLIDDSNYASLPFERSGDVYENPVEGFKQMVADGQITKEYMDSIIEFANKNGIPLDDQFGKNPKYLLWQKQETYDALTKNNGIVIATNNASPELVRGLSKYDGNIKVFWHQANHVPDQELGVAMRNKRPEYLAIFGGNNESFTRGTRSDSFYQGERFTDYGTTGRSDRAIEEVYGTNTRGTTEPELEVSNRSNADAREREKPSERLEKRGTIDRKEESLQKFLQKIGLARDEANEAFARASADNETQTIGKEGNEITEDKYFGGDSRYQMFASIPALTALTQTKKDKNKKKTPTTKELLQKLGL